MNIAVEQTELRIGELATRAGVSVDAVRYYERLRLLPRARRTSGGFRLFEADCVERIQFIKQAQELGYSLNEIKELLRLRTAPIANAAKARASAVAKLQSLDEKIAAMQHMRAELERLIANCDCGTTEQPNCVLLDAPSPTKES